MIEEVQGNYPNFKQNLAEKENLVILKSQLKPAAVQQMLSQGSNFPKVHNCALSKKQRIRKQKSSQKAVFSR